MPAFYLDAIGSALPSGSLTANPFTFGAPTRSRTPQTCGAAIEVPESVVTPPPFWVDGISTPGAVFYPWIIYFVISFPRKRPILKITDLLSNLPPAGISI